MATDNRTGHSLFPDVTENYERDTATAESAPKQSPPAAAVEPTPAPIPEPAVEQAPVPIPEPAREASPGEVLAGAAPEPDPEPELPVEFDQMPTWLVSPESPAPEPKKRKKRAKREKVEQAEKPEKPEKPEQPERVEQAETTASESGGRKLLLIGAAAVALLAIASAATVVVIGGGDTATEGTAKPVAAAADTASATSAASASPEAVAPVPAWCAESAADGRSVGRGPGGTSDGPGVIRAFDHAYYVERDGARVASLMVAPNAVPEIQRFIDGVPLGAEHCVTIASTPDPNVFNVDLLLRTPGASEGVIRQRITVAPSPEGFKIAKVEDAQ